MARLIVVSGPNASGKTTLIKKSQPELSRLGYHIIIPDELDSTSTTPISDSVHYCIRKNKNTVFESPLQYEELIGQVKKFAEAGYQIVLIQLQLESAGHSAIRVRQRDHKGGMPIPSKEVKANFENNFNHIIQYHNVFHQCYFIDSSTMENPIIAEINHGRLKFYYPNQSVAIKEMLYQIVMTHGNDKHSLTLLKENKVAGSLSYKQMNKALRLMLKLRRPPAKNR